MLIEAAFGDKSHMALNVVVNRNLQDWEVDEYEKMLKTLATVHLSN